MIAVDANDKRRVITIKIHTLPDDKLRKIPLKVGDTYQTNFIMLHHQDKVTESYTNINGVETRTVVFEASGIVSGAGKEAKLTYTSEGGATIHLGVNNIVTKIEGAVYVTKEKL